MRFVITVIGLIILSGIIIVSLSSGAGISRGDIQANVGGMAPFEVDSGQFERAYGVKPFTFPDDFGAHPGFQTEWWYYTGNLGDEAGNRYGFQLTFFRRGLSGAAPARESEWGSNQIYFAHFTITDVSEGAFYPHERFSRGGAGLAGAESSPYRVWLENWQVIETETGAVRLSAADADVSLDLTLETAKPPTLQGEQGFSPKSAAPGNASYYYSLTRNKATGVITTPNGVAAVSGNVWQDHEWSTSALGAQAQGWDWFSLNLDDGRDVMFFQIRQQDGSIEAVSGGSIVSADGETRPLDREAVEIRVLDYWESEKTGAKYPVRRTFSIPSEGIDLTLTPLVDDQELVLSFTYWEGAVRIEGTQSGYGYVEMTGYSTQAGGNSTADFLNR